MEKVLLTVTAALGLISGLGLCANHQYHFIYEQKNFTEALSYCRENYADLAAVDTMEDMNTLMATADTSQMLYTHDPRYSNRSWIGLYDDVNSWRWSLSNASFYKHKEAEFRMWKPGEPNNQNSKGHCTVMYNRVWYDQSCEDFSPMVCSNVTGSNVTFVFIGLYFTWSEAQNYCRTHHTDLASVRNDTENEEVANQVPPEHKAWIGLFRDSWKWVDGRKSAFRYWKTSEPDNREKQEACVAADFSHSGQWEDSNCDYRRAFVCYSALKRVVKIKVVIRSFSPGPNDPAVLEDILEQLKRQLKSQGVSEELKLSWNQHSDGKVFHKAEETDEALTQDEC